MNRKFSWAIVPGLLVGAIVVLTWGNCVLAQPAGAATNAVPGPVWQPVSFETLAAYAIKVDWIINPTNSSLDTLRRNGEIPAAIKALQGRKVAVQGYMKPLKQDARGVQEFLLMRNHGLCCQTNVPQINEWIHVQVKGKSLPFAHDRQFLVRGELEVGEKLGAGNVVSVYRLSGEAIEAVAHGH
jgi:hypothetical protein